MQLEHTFTVPAGIDQAWQVLLDIERIAPCMPGAAIDTVDGDDFTGTVKVRLGPIGLTYKGKASFTEKNESEHRAVIDAQGKDSRGNGTASAKVTATLVSEGADSTAVTVLTDLNITGKPAQFGRGVMVDVGNKLIGQFADCLAGKLAEGDDAAAVGEARSAAVNTTASTTPDSSVEADSGPAADPTTAATPAAAAQAETENVAGTAPTADPRPAPSPEPSTPQPVAHGRPAADVEPIDLLGSAGPAVAKRLVPVLAVVAVILFAVLRRRRS